MLQRSDDGSQDSTRSLSFVPSPAHDDIPLAMDGDDISSHTTVEMEKASHHPPDHQLGKTLGDWTTWAMDGDDFAHVQMEMQASIDS
jgi:hypothetical protein